MKRLLLPLPFAENAPLSRYTTFGIGGPARYLVEVTTIDELQNILAFAHRESVPTLVIGKGSNLLLSDSGFEGIAILNKIVTYTREGLLISVGGGYSFSLLGKRTARENLSGLEFAAGIPATVGGAIYMNAGIGSEQTCDPLIEVTYVSEAGQIEVYPKEALSFSYRTSPFQKMRGVIAGARFQLSVSIEARKKVQELTTRRLATQPYKEKSAGCVFRNPPGGLSAGALIDQCGLKGVKRGGAEVSAVHANFIINRAGASANDVLELAAYIQDQVKRKTGITLEKELEQK